MSLYTLLRRLASQPVRSHRPRRPFARRILVEALESRTLLTAGALDTSFSGDGKFTLPTTEEKLTATDVAVQSDGKTVIVGVTENTTTGEKRFATLRLNPDGTVDTSFADHGIARTELGGLGNATAHAVAIAPDGKIVVVGIAESSAGINEPELGIARYNTNGSLDTSFDGDGKTSFDRSTLGGLTEAEDVAVQLDGRIIVVGTVLDGYLAEQDFIVMRINVDGSADFDSNIGIDGADTAVAVKLANGHIFIAGNAQQPGTNRVGLVRTTHDGDNVGDFATSFSLPGRAMTVVEDMILQEDKMVIAGHTVGLDGLHDFFIARFNADGVLDTTFGEGGSGFRVTDFGGDDTVGGMVISPSGGGFIVSGRSLGSMTAVKYTDDGAIDTTFGGGGIVRVSGFGGTANIARGPGRRVVLAGGNEFATARLLTAGANVVHATAFLDNIGSETRSGLTPDQATFFVFREERLPFPTRVFFSIGGTARFSATFGSDYQLIGMNVSGTPFVDIPINQTFALVTLAPLDDTLVEGTETAVFTIQPSTTYDIGTPSSAELTIRDNDFYFTSRTTQGTLATGTAAVTPSAAELPANGKITYSLTWTTPGVWRDLDTIEFRIVDEFGQDVLAWILWNETTNTLSLRDPQTGLFSESGQPGSNKKLKAGNAELDLRNSSVVGSGPLGPSVTLTLDLKLHVKKPHGLVGPLNYSLEVFASNHEGDKQGFDEVGTLRLRS